MLVLLDLSAAFDTIDHKIMIDRLKAMYGIEGTALNWFKSYLSNRSQSIIIGNSESKKLPLKYGVPQGSKLGPILFNSYIAPVSEIAAKNQVCDEKYADDEQLILSFKPQLPASQTRAVGKMEKCIDDIRSFLNKNKLCNNSDKTEFLLVGTAQQMNNLNISSIKVDGVTINPVTDVRNLGVIFDKHMSMEKQISKMCRNAYFNIRNISKIKNNLDIDDIKTVVNALVTPHLDYGNSLLSGISKKLAHKLQVAQNSAARLILNIGRFDSITQHRKNLHWLPILARIQFKILTLVWKTLNNQAPDYLVNLIKLRSSSHNLRNKFQLDIPKIKNQNNLATKAFSWNAPKLWNELPADLKCKTSLNTFKNSLKTYLFRKFYD